MTEFEPFDLARAEAGEPVMFRFGNESVQFLRAIRNSDGSVRCILFIITDALGNEFESTTHPDGRCMQDGKNRPLDIVMNPQLPVTKTFWACFDLNQYGKLCASGVTATDESEKWQYCIPFEFTLPPPTR